MIRADSVNSSMYFLIDSSESVLSTTRLLNTTPHSSTSVLVGNGDLRKSLVWRLESDAFLSIPPLAVGPLWQSSGRAPATISQLQLLENLRVEWVCYPQPGEQQEFSLFHVRRIETGVFVGTCQDAKTEDFLSTKVIYKALLDFWGELGASSFVLSSSLPLTLKPAPCMSGDGDIVTGLPGHLNQCLKHRNTKELINR